MINIYEQVDSNKFKSNMVVLLFMVFIALAAYIMALSFGYSYDFVAIALIFAGVGSLISYYYSDKIILSMSGAKEATREEYFDFYTVTENLCLAAQLPFPKLYVINDTAMNAFATGRDPKHAVVCATTGILSGLDRTELEGVIAHELSHVRNYDIRLMSIVSILVGSVTLLADWMIRANFLGGNRKSRSNNSGEVGMIIVVVGFLLALLSPIIANLIKLAISRRREFLADASGAELTKYPEGLARALEKLQSDQEPLEAANKATAHLYIASPFFLDRNRFPDQHKKNWLAGMFSTHPPIEERIAALRAMG